MEIRTIKTDEFDEFMKMGEFAFQYTLSEEAKDKRKRFFDLNTCWALFDEGKMASKLTIHPMEIWLGEKTIQIGGIAGVATWPEHRRKGFVQRLMKKSLEIMKENGQTVSMLHPFSFAFYRKYGWEMTHTMKLLEFKPDDIAPDSRIRGTVSRTHHDVERLDRMYNTYAQRYSGMLKRSREWWSYSVLNDPDEVVSIYQDELGEDRGYILYHVKDDTMTIEEMITLDEEARRALLQFIRNHDSMVKSITLQVPEHDDFAFELANPKIKQEIKSYFMSRIVDVEAFLREYPFRSEIINPIIFHVEDRFVDGNNGTFIIRDENGKRQVDRYGSKEGTSCQHPPQRGLSCDINAFSAMFLHYKRPSSLWQNKRLNGNANEVQQLEELIRSEQTFLYDFF